MNSLENIDLNILDVHPKNAVLLFKVMMRLEYAIKETGFIKTNRKNKVSCDWNSFATNTITNDFYDNLVTKGVAPTLFENPPSHQVLTRDGCLGFVDAEKPSNAQELRLPLVVLPEPKVTWPA